MLTVENNDVKRIFDLSKIAEKRNVSSQYFKMYTTQRCFKLFKKYDIYIFPNNSENIIYVCQPHSHFNVSI